jgi:hypothetical protein
MSYKMKSMLKSYARGVLVAITPLLAIQVTDLWAYVIAVVSGVIAPALRAIDKNDPAFGAVADTVENAIITAATKQSKKKTK